MAASRVFVLSFFSVVLLFGAVVHGGQSVDIAVDFSKTALPFDGIGALSGGGGTSRLLYDYEEPFRSTILDALFVPKQGANLQILKVEIGGDTQSTEATEASHMHTRDDLNFERGYEWWLMTEAKKRNPDIKLYGLSWGVPGWIGNGNYYSQDNIDYHIKWLQGAQSTYNLTIDYMGIWNERQYDRDWIVSLRAALDTSGYGHVQIVAPDLDWSICADMASNQSLYNAVAVVGAHYPITTTTGGSKLQKEPFSQNLATRTKGKSQRELESLSDSAGKVTSTVRPSPLPNHHGEDNNSEVGPKNAETAPESPYRESDGETSKNAPLKNDPAPSVCQSLGKPLWTSEGWDLGDVADWNGGTNLARTINENWILSNQTAMIVWAVIYSWYCMLPFSTCDGGAQGHGLMYATEPWSGHYSIQSPLYAVAHTTQFVLPGCSYIWSSSTGIGGRLYAGSSSSIVAFHCPSSVTGETADQYTLVLDTFSETDELDVTFDLSSLNIAQGTSFNVWMTNSTNWFESQGSVAWDGSLILTLQPGSLYTISSSTGQQAVPSANIPASQTFPLPYADDFEGYADQATVRYLTDEGGSFCATSLNGNGVLAQQVTQIPIAWETNPSPYTILGDSNVWADYNLSVSSVAEALPSSDVNAELYTCGDFPGFQNFEYNSETQQIIFSSNTSLCLSLGGYSPSFPDNNLASLTECDASNRSQIWSYYPSSRQFVNNEIANCLDVMGAVQTDGTPVFTYPCNGGLNQQWLIQDGELLSMMNTSKCLTATPPSTYTKICGRISSYQRNGAPVQGYCLVVDEGLLTWSLTTPSSTLASGPINPQQGAWRNLSLAFHGSTITPMVDGVVLCSMEDSTFPVGMAGLGSGWHPAFFDNLLISPASSS